MRKKKAIKPGSKILYIKPKWTYHCIVYKKSRMKIRGEKADIVIIDGREEIDIELWNKVIYPKIKKVKK